MSGPASESASGDLASEYVMRAGPHAYSDGTGTRMGSTVGPGRWQAAPMHRWDEATDLLAHSVIGYAIERLKTPKDPTWGARPADELAARARPHDHARGHRRPPRPDAVPRRADARLPADGLAAAPRLRRHRADAGGQHVRPRRQRVEHLRRAVGGRRRRHRGREPDARVARRPGRLPGRRRRLLRQRRLGGQPVGARHGAPPRPRGRRRTAGPLALRHDRRDARLGPRRGARDGRRRRARRRPTTAAA